MVLTLSKNFCEYKSYTKLFNKMIKIDSLKNIGKIVSSILNNKSNFSLNLKDGIKYLNPLTQYENLVRFTLAHWEKHYSTNSIDDKNIHKFEYRYWKIIEKILPQKKDKHLNKKEYNILLRYLFIALHDQLSFPPQEIFNKFYKYLRLYSQNNIKEYISEKIWISVENLFKIWLTYFIYFKLEREIGKTFFYKKNNNIYNKEIDMFHKLFIIEIDNVSNIIKEKMDNSEYEDRLYAWKRECENTPIYEIKKDNTSSLICPLPYLIIFWITLWLPYKIKNNWTQDWKFWQYLWDAFETFIGEIIKQYKGNSKILKWVASSGKSDADRFMLEKKILLVIECKARKLKHPTKFILSNKVSLEKDINIFIDALIQCHKSSLYQNISHKFKQESMPDTTICIVVILEDSFLEIINELSYEEIDNWNSKETDEYVKNYKKLIVDKLNCELNKNKIKKDEFYEKKYLLLSSSDFEILFKSIEKYWLKKLTQQITNNINEIIFWLRWLDQVYRDISGSKKTFYENNGEEFIEKIKTTM